MSRFSSKEEKLLSLMERTGYNIIQENGQRTFGPPPDWPEKCTPPAKGCEVFVGKIPRDCYEDELVPIFERIGKIYQLRLMMDFSGSNRGYAFVTFVNLNDAKTAIKELNGFEIRPNKYIGVVKSIDNCRLFIGGIPLNKTRSDVIEELSKVTEGVVNAIVYNTSSNKNRGFTFVEYVSHKHAAMARRRLLPGKILLWGHEVTVDWAVPEPSLDDSIMSKVTVLFIRHLSSESTEDSIKSTFSLKSPSKVNVQKVKKIKNYAFVHYFTREDAELALRTLSALDLRYTGLTDEGQQLEVTWAKPPNAVKNQRRKGRYIVSSHSGGDVNHLKNNPFSPTYGAILNPLSPTFELNHSNVKHFQTPTLLSNLMSGDPNAWTNNIRNSPSVVMSGVRHSRNNSTPVWYPIENAYPWLPLGIIRSPQSIGLFRSSEPYSVFQ